MTNFTEKTFCSQYFAREIFIMYLCIYCKIYYRISQGMLLKFRFLLSTSPSNAKYDPPIKSLEMSLRISSASSTNPGHIVISDTISQQNIF